MKSLVREEVDLVAGGCWMCGDTDHRTIELLTLEEKLLISSSLAITYLVLLNVYGDTELGFEANCKLLANLALNKLESVLPKQGQNPNFDLDREIRMSFV